MLCLVPHAILVANISYQAVLGRNVMGDLIKLHNKLEKDSVGITEVRKNAQIFKLYLMPFTKIHKYANWSVKP